MAFSIRSIINSLQQEGFALLQKNNTPLKLVSQLLGNIQGTPKSDVDGITKITSGTKYTNLHNTIHFDDLFYPHTDGAYLNGLAYNQTMQKMQRIFPPKFVGLKAIEPTTEGGQTILIDGKEILEHLIAEKSPLLPTLFQTGVTTFCHGPILCCDQPLFGRINDTKLALRYSCDKEFLATKEYGELINEFNTHYVNNPKFHKQIQLYRGDTLFIDNYRMLHGRAPFKGNRLYERVWISSNMVVTTPVLDAEIHYEEQEQHASCTEIYNPYLLIDPIQEIPSIQAGIHLSDTLNEQLACLVATR